MTDGAPVVVIGTGPAGASAALFLSRAGQRPLLLEAGSGKVALGLTARIRGITVAKQKPRLRRRGDVTNVGDPAAEIFEELAPGGLSNHWACAVPRFAPEDFADAARAGVEHTWPVGYHDLEPWYEQVEPLLRIAGSRRDAAHLPAGSVRSEWRLGAGWEDVVRAAAGLGRDVVPMPYAYGAETMVTRSATAFNAYTRLLKPAVRGKTVTIRYDAAALRLEWCAKERRVTGVTFVDPSTGASDHLPCRAVVLAAGAVNSAKILLQSRSPDFPDGLGNTHGVLGRYLHDHPLAKIVLDLGRAVPLAPASYITRPPLELSEPLYAAAFMQWTSALERARALLALGRSRQIGFSVFGTMAPSPDDRITLGDGVGNGHGPSIRLSLRHPAAAVRLLERARDDLLSVLERAGWEPRLRVFKIEVPGNSVHYGGTCRMHALPRFGVVDAFSRVHGVPNVVVADSSVFTTGPEKNPVLTAMTLAARAADRLAVELGDGDL